MNATEQAIDKLHEDKRVIHGKPEYQYGFLDALDSCKQAIKPTAELEARIEELETLCGEAYQAIGYLCEAQVVPNENILRLMDNLGAAQMVHKNVLPIGVK